MLTNIRKKLRLNICDRKSGFTLVESIVTVFIFAMILSGVYATLAVGDDSWQTNKTKIELQQEARKAMEYMINDLRQAGDASITNVPANNTWYSTITFKIPSGVSSGSITWNNNSIVLAKGGTGNSQLIRTYAGNPKILAQNLQSIQFRRQSTSPDILEVSIQEQGVTAKNRTLTYTLNFSLQLRN